MSISESRVIILRCRFCLLQLDCDEELTAKRARDEEVQELHAQLMKSDSERNNALRAQEDITNMAKLYRSVLC